MKRLLLPLAAALAVGTVMHAQPGDHDGPPPGGPRRGSPFIRVLDTDHDHELSAAEIAAAGTRVKTLDTDGDGAITPEELRPPRPADAPPPPSGAPARGAKGRPADPIFLALDTDGDGVLSASEIAAAPTSLAVLDTNHDGKLSEGEFRPAGAPAPDGPPPQP